MNINDSDTGFGGIFPKWPKRIIGPALGFALVSLLMPAGRADELLELFRPVDGWRSVREVSAVPGKTELKVGGKGGIVVNGTTKAERAPYLFTKEGYGDVRVEIEFMIPKGANAGVYLMGRYEVQILDSFGKARVGAGDMGGIYQRWDKNRPKGKQGFEGTPPVKNAAKPPGEWQKFEIVFRAPRFDEAGKKTVNATFEKVLVNGVLVQENASTTGPTRAAPLDGEVARGPVAIQGDHGPMAIRQFHVTPLASADEQARTRELDAYWAEVSRAVNEGDFEAYEATCHAEAVLVTGIKKTSYPLSKALARWKQEFVDTMAGKRTSSVEFRFSRRLGDVATAHETGIFLYAFGKAGEELQKEHIHFEALLVKKGGEWKILMEYQKASASEAEWKSLDVDAESD